MPALYTFDVDDLLAVLRQLVSEAVRIAIVGHNPAMTMLVTDFLGSPVNIPTAGVANSGRHSCTSSVLDSDMAELSGALSIPQGL